MQRLGSPCRSPALGCPLTGISVPSLLPNPGATLPAVADTEPLVCAKGPQFSCWLERGCSEAEHCHFSQSCHTADAGLGGALTAPRAPRSPSCRGRSRCRDAPCGVADPAGGRLSTPCCSPQLPAQSPSHVCGILPSLAPAASPGLFLQPGLLPEGCFWRGCGGERPRGAPMAPQLSPPTCSVAQCSAHGFPASVSSCVKGG